jgi:sulfatase modifying factor 1
MSHLQPAVECRPEETAFLRSIVDNPGDVALWLILADWLEEHDDPRRAELLRLHRSLIATCCEPEQHPERAQQQARLVQLLTAGVRPSVPRQTLTLAKGESMAFAWIPPGIFLMGSPKTEAERQSNERQHRVTLTRGLWLGVTPVTQAQWQAVMGNNPSGFKGDNLPVETVSWDDCQEFCRQLSERLGKSLRLPTEAEWEYACRAGTTTPFFFGPTLSSEQANYDGRYPYGAGPTGEHRGKTTAVCSFPSNAWGLYDLHGNVWEWCQDWYGAYGSKAVPDPVGSKHGTARVLRGGSWNDQPRLCRAANRGWNAPAIRCIDFGLRVAFRLD